VKLVRRILSSEVEKLGRALWGGVLQMSARQRALLLDRVTKAVVAELPAVFPSKWTYPSVQAAFSSPAALV